jgi:ribose-phosphate pyrophosphokinase
MEGSAAMLADPSIDRLIVTDTVPPFRLGPGAHRDKVEVLSAAPLLAEAIGRLHAGRSLADLVVF